MMVDDASLGAFGFMKLMATFFAAEITSFRSIVVMRMLPGNEMMDLDPFSHSCMTSGNYAFSVGRISNHLSVSNKDQTV